MAVPYVVCPAGFAGALNQVLLCLCESLEFIEAYGFGIEVDQGFDCVEELAVANVFTHASQVVLVFKDAAGVVGDGLVVHIGHAVLCELLESKGFGELQHVVVCDLDVEVFGDFATEEFPADRGGHLVVFLIDVFGGQPFVACHKPFFQEFRRQVEVAETGHQFFLNVAVEKVVAVGEEL